MPGSADILNARILVVDDKPANVRLLEGMLRGAGYVCVESTTDPSEVCELHRRNRYGLILLDLQMPRLDGFQVMECLGELKLGKEKTLVMKEALLGLLYGVLVGLVAAICMYVVAAVKHLPNAFMLSVVVFLAMIGSCVISGICGAIMPLVLKKLGADPVIASSIFLTTATNVASMALLLGLAAVLVK